MKGVILAGGTGSRLFPLTSGISKQLLPVYDKPLIYYPLSILMIAGIRDILIITTQNDQNNFIRALGNGSQFGIKLSYLSQSSPKGIAHGLIIAEEFIAKQKVCMVLGDNIFWGHGFSKQLEQDSQNLRGARIFAYQVKNPTSFGVVDFDEKNQALCIEEKPINPKSNFAVTGLYFYDENVSEIAKSVKPSIRGELEISSLNQIYINMGLLDVSILGRGFAWLDTGTHENLFEAATFVNSIEKRQGLKIACLEEIGWRKGWIDSEQLKKNVKKCQNSDYGKYINSLLRNVEK